MSENTTDILEAASKDHFFKQIGEIADAMVRAHGKEFAMGALVLAARFIAEGKDSSFVPKDGGPAKQIAP